MPEVPKLPAPRITWRHRAEYGGLRALEGIFSALPYRAALLLAAALGAVGYGLARGRVKAARQRIREALGVTEREARRIAWHAWRHLVFHGVDFLRARRVTLKWVRRVTDWKALETLQSLLRSGQSAVLAIPHMGSWELAGLSASLLGIPLLYITRQQKNPLTNGYLNRVRSRTGAMCLDRDDPGLVRAVLREIRRGRVLAILPDIRARTEALRITFLGREVSVAAGMGLFARQANAPILAACVLREGWARHRWKVLGIVRPDPARNKEDDWRRMTQEVFDLFSAEIRAHPEQYFWFNKKWIFDTAASARADRDRDGLYTASPS